MTPRRLHLIAVCLLAFLGACRATLPPHRTLAPDGTELRFEELIDELEPYDVVFLGELHDSGPTHELQLAVTQALLERHGRLTLSMEMFESDVQPVLDDYLAGRIDEEAFLAASRPWGNYREHYRSAVELMREAGQPVLAANVPRPLAARVGKEGVFSVMGEEHAPRLVHAYPAGGYFERMCAIAGAHERTDFKSLEPWYAAQCLKDDAMAESIADHLARRPEDPPVVVHWCGRFHSDYHQGTVERLRWRRPDLSMVVVTVVRTPHPRDVEGDPSLGAADFVWCVKR